MRTVERKRLDRLLMGTIRSWKRLKSSSELGFPLPSLSELQLSASSEHLLG